MLESAPEGESSACDRLQVAQDRGDFSVQAAKFGGGRRQFVAVVVGGPGERTAAAADDTETHTDPGPPGTDGHNPLSGLDTAPGTMRMARRLLDPATEAEIQALAPRPDR